MSIEFEDRNYTYTHTPTPPPNGASANQGPLRTIAARLMGQMAAITGQTNWYQLPSMTINAIISALPVPATQTVAGVAELATDSEVQTGTDVSRIVTPSGLKAGTDTRTRKADVSAATTANITLSGTQTIDTIALNAGDRVLVKNQTTASQNGIYVVSAAGWSRASDANESADFQYGQEVRVRAGTQAGLWYLSSSTTVTVGTTPITYSTATSSAAHSLWSASHTDVDTTDIPTNGDVVTYNSTTSKWVAAPSVAPDYIQGLELAWDSATTLGVEVGSAYVESVGGVVTVPTRRTITFSGLTTNTLYYVYLKSDGTCVASGAAPAAPYYGIKARSQTSDTSRRYIGEVLARSATTIWQFDNLTSRGRVLYHGGLYLAPFAALADGRTTTETNVTLPCVPATARSVDISALHSSGSQYLRLGYPGDGVALSTNEDVIGRVTRGSANGIPRESFLAMPCDSSQRITYNFGSDPGATFGAYITVRGYGIRR